MGSSSVRYTILSARLNRQTSMFHRSSLSLCSRCLMRYLRSSIVVLALSSAMTVFGQSAPPEGQSGSSTASGPVDLTGFKTNIEQKNKALTDQVSSEKAIVKKNSEIIEDAKRIDAENKKLQAARKALDAQN